jgi:hypothetical protein
MWAAMVVVIHLRHLVRLNYALLVRHFAEKMSFLLQVYKLS